MLFDRIEYKKAEGLHESAKASKAAVKEKHEGIKKDTDAKLAKVLTPDQNKKLEVIKAEKKGQELGNINIVDNGKVIKTVPLVALEDVAEGGIISRAIDYVKLKI